VEEKKEQGEYFYSGGRVQQGAEESQKFEREYFLDKK
jgi:hypothetical protein